MLRVAIDRDRRRPSVFHRSSRNQPAYRAYLPKPPRSTLVQSAPYRSALSACSAPRSPPRSLDSCARLRHSSAPLGPATLETPQPFLTQDLPWPAAPPV